MACLVGLDRHLVFLVRCTHVLARVHFMNMHLCAMWLPCCYAWAALFSAATFSAYSISTHELAFVLPVLIARADVQRLNS